MLLCKGWKMAKIPLEYKLIGGLVIAILLYVWSRGIGGAAKDIASGTVDAAAGATAGAAEGIGGIFGIPTTDTDRCEIACANGNTWEASKYCAANRFLKYLGTGK